MNLINIAKHIIDKANSKGIKLRAFGRIGVAISCKMEEIDTQDIDLFGSDIKVDLLSQFFREIGFPHKKYNNAGCYNFYSSDNSLRLDVYLNELVFAYKVPGPFFPTGQYTIPVTQLFLSKLYYSDENKWKEKSRQDLIDILRTHQIGRCKDYQSIQIGILQETWCYNTDSYKIFSFCENKLIEILKICEEDSNVTSKIEYLLEIIRITPKNCPYKVGKCLKIGHPHKVEAAFDECSYE